MVIFGQIWLDKLGRISAETCQKRIIMVVNTKFAKCWGSAHKLLYLRRMRASHPRPLLRFNDKIMCKTLHLLNISGWCRCLAILRQNETYILYFLPSLSKKRSCAI